MTHPTAPPSATGGGNGEAWWLLESPEFALVAGGLTPPDLSSSTGSLWRLEYSDSRQTVQLVADKGGGLFSELAAASPEVGTMTIDGVEVTLRQHPGRPQEGIAPSVGADWVDGDVFLSFGGAGLAEDGLRALLSQVRRSTPAEWSATASTVEQAPSPGP